MAARWHSMSPEFPTNDIEKSISYFVTHLGFSTAFHLPEVGYAKVERDELSIFLSLRKGKFEPCTCMIYVSHIQKAYEELLAAGASILVPPRLLSVGTTEFSVGTPDGHVLTFFF